MSLKKELGFWDVFCIAAGAMISSGLFILPGLAYLKTGPSAFVAYFIAGFLVLPAMFSKAELSTAMPKSGGIYFFIDRSMGAGMGSLAGISAWFSLSFKSAFALLGIGAFTKIIYPNITMIEIKIIAVSFCVLFTIINLRSVKHAGKFQIYLVTSLIILISWFVIKGMPKVNVDNFRPFMSAGYRELFSTVGLIFISYGGLTKVASIAEEVKNPTKNIPLGMFSAFTIVTVLYVLVVFVTVGILGNNLVNNGEPTLTPISDAANISMGNLGAILLAIAALFAFISTGNAGIMAASRAPMAMAKDNLLPSFFEKESKKYKTPTNSIIFTSIFMIIVILFLDLEMLVKTASTIKILLFTSVNLAVIIMRESGLHNYKPKFKSPFYPWIQIFGIVAYTALIIDMGTIPLLIAGIFLISGLLWYWFYGRIKSNRKSAIIHFIKKVTAKELTGFQLESELKEIIFDRDNINKDFFDTAIENSSIIDLDEEINVNDLFIKISKEASKKLNTDFNSINDKIKAREKESSTAITPNVAIPHIIIEGENLFEIILVRNKKGIYFSEESPSVDCVFTIIGTKDLRTIHLKALAAIAQLIQNPEFNTKWLEVKNKENLIDLILLGERIRE